MTQAVACRVPGWFRRRATAHRIAFLEQLSKFAVVGSVGMAVDIATISVTRDIAGLYWAGLAGFGVAVHVNFLLNRAWTFKAVRGASIGRQWKRFLLANAGGFFVNRGVYFLLVWSWPLARAHPAVAVIIGVLAGMLLNFQLTRLLVFRQ